MKHFKVGFTGTRDGLTGPQRTALLNWLKANPPSEVHHGMCVGADAEFSRLVVDAVGINQELPYEVAHPSNLKGLQDSDCWADEKRKPLPPLKRNQNIVNSVEVLLVAPKGPEELRSGTWSCCRYARKVGIRRIIFWPDGKVEEE